VAALSRDPRGWTTVLFVPADRPGMLAKAQTRGADAILVDLEDAIPLPGKAEARAALREAASDGTLEGPAAVCVRINAVGEGCDEDLEALADLTVDAVMLPKAASMHDVRAARWALDRFLADPELVALVPQVESARAVANLGPVTTDPIDGLAFGGEDFCVDLGVTRSDDSVELLLPRALVALHACARGVAAIDTVYSAIGDEAGLIREATLARQLGFTGKLLVHPSQVEPVRRVFTPSDEQVEWARRILASGEEDASGVRVVDGRMVDAPVIAQAERILAKVG